MDLRRGLVAPSTGMGTPLDRPILGWSMVLLDQLLDGGTLKYYGVDDDTIADIRKVLNGHHADVLDQSITPVGHGDFGASNPGITLGFNADLAHQHVVAALKEMADGLAGFAGALKQAADHMTSVDEDSAAATSQLDTSLSQVDTTFDGADTQGTGADQSTVGGTAPAGPSAPSPSATDAGGPQ